ncbi:GNAT family N-acetyltransferase [Desemzia sp. RIT804]|uniref:GNAT family N-acetyltransferase n=1 Tax=Desemzia sp. RIT 804 TaxID=2810209 RepID=UPI001951B6D3|nr:GNAT family N-acetyltransferase [Desemzia sp. RIT 804]MBM6614431.1 GNAT family N-acetyltransferase [Desemzia sp. RIT 804]
MSNVEKLTQEKFEEAYDLAVYAFNLEQDSSSKEKFQSFFDATDTFGIFQNERLSSQLQVLPLDIYLHGINMSMGGISLVSSYPETRGMGNIKKLFVEALNDMNTKGMVLSYLDPFSYPFYRKFGYEVAFNEVIYEINAANLPRTEKYSGSMTRVNWDKEKEQLKKIYQDKYSEAIGPVKRIDWNWKRKISQHKNQKIALYKDTKDQPKGYVIYHFDKAELNRFIIDEMIYLDQDAFIGIWQFIGSHQTSFEKFIYSAGEEEYIVDMFPDLRIKKEIKPFMMARIVNIETFLMQYPFKEKAQTTFYLRVTDKMASWNQGLWKVELRKTGRKVTKIVNENEIKDSEVLSASIQTWTQLFMNHRTMEGLHFHQRIIGSIPTAVDLADRIPSGTSQLYDHF